MLASYTRGQHRVDFQVTEVSTKDQMGTVVLLHFSSNDRQVDPDCDTARLALNRLPDDNMQSKRRPVIICMRMQIPDATPEEDPLRRAMRSRPQLAHQ